MPVDDFIRTPDYNNIRNTIVAVMSTGSASQGYGQSLASGPVADFDFVSKTQWDNLRFDIVNAIVHQTGALPTIVTIAEGDTIRYASDQPNFQYNTLANLANTNRFDLGAGQFATEAGVTNSGQTVSFSNSVSCSVTLTFATANDARYFFNSGGKIRFTSSFTPTLINTQNTTWQSTLTSASASPPIFGGQTPATNFYNLTTSDQQFYSVQNSSPYSSNSWRLFARCNVANNSSGTANQVTFTSTWQDNYTDPGSPPPGDLVQGSIVWTLSHIRAVGALYPGLVAASFSAPRPTYGTISSITGS
jgi:hypothetical protein